MDIKPYDIEPLHGMALVEQERQTTTDSGLIISESNKKKGQMGKVIAVGPDVDGVEVGDFLLFRLYEADMIDVGGETKYLLVDTEGAIGRVKNAS